MSVLPDNKYFRIIKGATFDYSWQLLTGSPDQSSPWDLTHYTGTWTLHTTPSNTVYTTGGSAGNSGVFFGGPNNDPETGIIDLIIDEADTAAINWTTVQYTFFITQTNVSPNVVTPLLVGALQVVRVLP